MTDISLHVKFNHLDGLTNRTLARARVALDRELADVEQEAKATSPFRTGALRSSGFRITPVTNTYSAAVAAMHSINAQAKASPMPVIPRGKLAAVVGFSADYAQAVHDGGPTGHGGFRAGRPWLTQVAHARRDRIQRAIKESFETAARGG